MNNTSPDSITGAELETLTGISERRVRQIADLGKIPQPSAGIWPRQKVIRQLFDYYRSRREPDALTDARLKKLEAEATLAEGEVHKMHSEWVPVELVGKSLDLLISELRQKILYSKLTPQEKSEVLKDLQSVDFEGMATQAAAELEAEPDHSEA